MITYNYGEVVYELKEEKSLLHLEYSEFEKHYYYEDQINDCYIADTVYDDYLIEHISISKNDLFKNLEKISVSPWFDSIGLYLPEWMFYDAVYIDEKMKKIILEKINDMFGKMSLFALQPYEQERIMYWREYLI